MLHTIPTLRLCLEWEISRRSLEDLVRFIDSEGLIFSIGKKREILSSMLVDKDGDPRPMLLEKDGDPRPMLVDKDGDPSPMLVDKDGDPRSMLVDKDGDP